MREPTSFVADNKDDMLIPFHELFQRHKIKTSGVLHLGANTGQEAEQYQDLKIPKVIWVEAEPNLFRALCRHIARFPGQIAVNACISDVQDEVVKFNISSNGGQSSSFLEFGTHSVEHPTVKFTRYITLRTSRIDHIWTASDFAPGDWFLNVDLQGAELKALWGIGDLLHQFKYAYIEVNEAELYKGCPRTVEIDAYLAEYGFVGLETKMTGSKWGDKFYAKP